LSVPFEEIVRTTMDEEYDVIVLGTGLKVSDYDGQLNCHASLQICKCEIAGYRVTDKILW